MKNINKVISLVFSGSLVLAVGAIGACGDDDGDGTGNAFLQCREVCVDTADCDANAENGAFECANSACVFNYCATDTQCEAASGISSRSELNGEPGFTFPEYCSEDADCDGGLGATVCIDVGDAEQGVCAVEIDEADCSVGALDGNARTKFGDGQGDVTVCIIPDRFQCLNGWVWTR